MKNLLLSLLFLTFTFTAFHQLVTPEAVNDAASICPGNPVSINVLANDTHGANNTLSIREYTNPYVGTLIKNADHTVATLS